MKGKEDLNIMNKKVKIHSHFSPPCGGRNSLGILASSLYPLQGIFICNRSINLPNYKLLCGYLDSDNLP